MHNMVQKSFSAVLVLGLTACANGDMAEGGADGATEIRVLTVGGTRIAMQALQAQYEAMSGNSLNISFNNPLLIEEASHAAQREMRHAPPRLAKLRPNRVPPLSLILV